MILLIDNYDSFTWNLWHFLADLGAEVETCRNDALTVDEILERTPQAIVLSPGPSTPDKAGICIPLIEAAMTRDLPPIFGVCLGHQAIGAAFGATIGRIAPPVHGKLSQILHQNEGVFADCPTPLMVTRYHSLVIERDSLPDCLQITAETEAGLIMGVAHCNLPIYGVQFHPESIASMAGYRILANFLRLAGVNIPDDEHIEQLQSQSLTLHDDHPEQIHA